MDQPNYNSSLVNLSIPKEVTNPIVAAKIQEAVLAALGGSESIIKGVVNQICNTMVNDKGNVSNYSSDNKIKWMDYHVTEIIQNAIRAEVKNQLTVGADQIKDEIIKQLQTKKGASKIATALLDAFSGTFSSEWRSKVAIEFSENKNH